MTRLPNPNDVVAQITIKLYANGSMSTEGNIGDKTLALGMLDHARASVADRLDRQRGPLILPNHEVHVAQDPRFPTLPVGDMRG